MMLMHGSKRITANANLEDDASILKEKHENERCGVDDEEENNTCNYGRFSIRSRRKI